MKRADARRYHYIYKITRFDGKYYIGMHSTENLEDGYFGSGKLITRSIRKYGIEKHSKEILEFLDSRSLLREREKEIVNEEIVNDTLCMNLQLGGGGGFIDMKHQQKCSSAGGKIGGKIAGKKNISIALKHMMETRTNYRTPGMTGKIHSPETKLKMSVSGSGEKNSQFGSCWVTNGVKPIKIKKEQLDEYLKNGYSRGRKMET